MPSKLRHLLVLTGFLHDSLRNSISFALWFVCPALLFMLGSATFQLVAELWDENLSWLTWWRGSKDFSAGLASIIFQVCAIDHTMLYYYILLTVWKQRVALACSFQSPIQCTIMYYVCHLLFYARNDTTFDMIHEGSSTNNIIFHLHLGSIASSITYWHHVSPKVTPSTCYWAPSTQCCW